MHVYYDEEGDFLELQVGEPRKGYFEELEEGIFQRRDSQTDEIIGVAIFGVKKRSLKEIDVPVKAELSAEA